MHSTTSGYRLRTVVLLLPAISILGTLGFAVRSSLAGARSNAIEQDMILGGVFVLILYAFGSALYLFTNIGESWNLNWRTILTTIYLTSALSALFYANVESDIFIWLVPISVADVVDDVFRRAILGTIDGIGYGLLLGGFICLFDPPATQFTPKGILHYSITYLLLIAGNLLIMFINFSSELGDRFSSILTILFIFSMISGLQWLNKRHD